jgi:lipopolysaccharide transport system permease protein
MAVQILTIGLVFGLLFGAPLEEFLPFLATGLILWTFISSTISSGATSFIAGEAIVRQLPIPQYLHVMRVIWRDAIMLAHNVVIIPGVFLFFLRVPDWHLLLVIPGFLLTATFLYSTAYVIGLLTTRFRDIQQIVASIMTVIFYMTPVIWQPTALPEGTAELLLGLNPIYHFLEIMRSPILGQAPTTENWIIASSISLIAGAVAFLVARKYKNRLAYWV